MRDKTIPNFFKPLFWSYNFDNIRPGKDKKTIIVNSINYGDLKHWKWLSDNYGKAGVAEVLAKVSASALRDRVRKLAGIIFKVKKFNYAPRGSR